jgi:hypothetical protein
MSLATTTVVTFDKIAASHNDCHDVILESRHSRRGSSYNFLKNQLKNWRGRRWLQNKRISSLNRIVNLSQLNFWNKRSDWFTVKVHSNKWQWSQRRTKDKSVSELLKHWVKMVFCNDDCISHSDAFLTFFHHITISVHLWYPCLFSSNDNDSDQHWKGKGRKDSMMSNEK